MNFIALDDEPLALVLIKKLAEALPKWELLATFTDAEEAAIFLQNNTVDLLLTDINMPDINGLKFVRELPDERPMVIFVTAYKEHAHEGFDLDVVDYLVKPVSQDRFDKAMRKASDLLELHHKAEKKVVSQEDDVFFVFSEYQQIKIIVKDILYVESMGDYVKIFLTTQSKPVLTLQRLKHLTSRLNPKGFLRIHRSYLINRSKIEAFQKSQVRVGGVWLPVGETYSEALHKKIGRI